MATFHSIIFCVAEATLKCSPQAQEMLGSLQNLWTEQAAILKTVLSDVRSSAAGALWCLALELPRLLEEHPRDGLTQYLAKFTSSLLSCLEKRLSFHAWQAPPAPIQIAVAAQDRGEKRARNINFLIQHRVNQLKRPRLAGEEQDPNRLVMIDGSANREKGNGLYLRRLDLEFVNARCLELVMDSSPFACQESCLHGKLAINVASSHFRSVLQTTISTYPGTEK
jgi:hypothetical protein